MKEIGRALTIVGGESHAGTYLLRIHLRDSLAVSFGRFLGGAPISLPAGEYAYVGSALGERGPATLARRLARHATRSTGRSPHPIRAAMVGCFPRLGLGEGDLLPRGAKKLFWHVDYLLEPDEAALTAAYIIRSPVPLERELAGLLQDDPATAVVARGLGASDAASLTHLYRVEAAAAWWENLRSRLFRLWESCPL